MLFIKIKKAWNNFLEKLAKENEKSFGGQKLDCCQLNNKSKIKGK
jgi:hypothetical protein